MKRKLFFSTVATLMIVLMIVGCAAPASVLQEPENTSAQPSDETGGAPAIPTIPETTIKIVQEPYYVCSAASIGIEKGWYKELGISFDPEPYGTIITGEDTTQYLASQKGDMVDQPTVQSMGAIKDLPPIKTFVFNSIFYGSVVLGQPGSKTVADFKAEGKTTQEAIALAMEQVREKSFAYDGTASSHSFVTSCLQLGDMTMDDITLSAFGDSEIVSMMLTNQIDFCGGMGLSAAQELMNKGMVVIVSASDVVESAEASASSPELRAVFQVGWTTYDSYIEENYDTILRFASVVWREARFINENREEAISIHLPFMNSISGSQNTEGDMESAYSVLTPYYSFEDQERWFEDPTYPLYYEYSIGAYIQDWQEKGYLAEGELKVEDVCIAQQVYQDMKELKAKSEAGIAAAQTAIAAGTEGDALTQAKTLLEKAQYYFDNYDFLDANTFAASAAEWAAYSNK